MMTPITLGVRLITNIILFFLRLGVRLLRPIWERIETEISPITQELQKAQVWFRSVGEQIWSYRWQLALSVVVLVVLLGYLLIQAFFIYLFLYNFIMVTPIQEHVEKPLHFVFPSQDDNHLPRTHFVLDDTVLTKYQTYQMKILLSLPESPPNFEIGMFMVNIDLTYENKNSSTCQPEVAGQSKRHAVLRWKTGLHRFLYTAFYWLPLVLGVTAVEEKQTLEVVMFDEFVYTPSRNGDHLALSIWLSEPTLQIYQGTLFIHAELRGLSYYCYHYFYTFLTLGTMAIFFIEIFFVSILSLSIGIIRYNKNQEEIASGTNLTGHRQHKVATPAIASVVQPTAVGVREGDDEESSSEAEAAGIGLHPSFPRQVASPKGPEDTKVLEDKGKGRAVVGGEKGIFGTAST